MSQCEKTQAHADDLLASGDWTGPTECLGSNKRFLHVFLNKNSDLSSVVINVHADGADNAIVTNTSLCIDGGSSILVFINDLNSHVLQTSGEIVLLYNEQILRCYDGASFTGPMFVLGDTIPESEAPGVQLTRSPTAAPTTFASCVSPNVELSLTFDLESVDNIGWAFYQKGSSKKPTLIRRSQTATDLLTCASPGEYLLTVLDFTGDSFNGSYTISVDDSVVRTREGSEFGFTDITSLSFSSAAQTTVTAINCPEGESMFSLELIGDAKAERETSWSLVFLEGSSFETLFEESSQSASYCLKTGHYYWDISDKGGDGLPGGSYTLKVDDTVITSGSGFGASDSINFYV